MPQFITYTGKLVDLQNPERASIDIEDIAHALSQLCRFAGHTNRFYSVAQHSIIVAQNVSPQHTLYGLLHDAAEAYMVDMPKPLKDMLPEYKVIEKRLETVIFKRFGLYDAVIPNEVDAIDKRLVYTEAIELGLRPQLWCDNITPLPVTIEPVAPEQAKELFLTMYQRLKNPGTE